MDGIIKRSVSRAAPIFTKFFISIIFDNKKFQQICLQGGFHDSYHNLSYKNVFGKLWVSTFCEQAEFVVKTDDDMYIDLYATYALTRC